MKVGKLSVTRAKVKNCRKYTLDIGGFHVRISLIRLDGTSVSLEVWTDDRGSLELKAANSKEQATLTVDFWLDKEAT